jgi:hypothetical protein
MKNQFCYIRKTGDKTNKFAHGKIIFNFKYFSNCYVIRSYYSELDNQTIIWAKIIQ